MESPALGIGTTQVNFQSEGNSDLSDLLNRTERQFDIIVAVALSAFIAISSAPVALLGFREQMRLNT